MGKFLVSAQDPSEKCWLPLAPLSEVALNTQVPEHGQSFCQGGQLGKFLVMVKGPSEKCWFPLAPLSEVALTTQVPEHGQSFYQWAQLGKFLASVQDPSGKCWFHWLHYLRCLWADRCQNMAKVFAKGASWGNFWSVSRTLLENVGFIGSII